MELTIDLSNTNIHDLEIERLDGASSIRFSVEGKIEDGDETAIREAFEAQELQPVELTVETGND